MEKILTIIKNCGAADVGALSYKNCDIINKRIEDQLQFTPRSVFIGTVPYYTHFCDCPRTVSAYALARDYHILLRNIGENAVRELKKIYPESNFKAFADHSPINEKIAAAKAGLGIIGDHSLLITEKYSSFVFLFEIITDIAFDIELNNVEHCEHCGACKKACPGDIFDKKTCLSAITQKKGELTESEKEGIARAKSAWGCDHCQLVCPHTQKAIAEGTIYTESSWFNSHIVSVPDSQSIENTEDFALRAYSWRGKQTILRNIELISEPNHQEVTI